MSKKIDLKNYSKLSEFKEVLYPKLEEECNKKRSYKDISKEKLKTLVLEKKLSNTKLSKYFNCNRGTIIKRKKKFNVYNNEIKNQYKIYDNIVKIQHTYKNKKYVSILDKNSFYKIKNIKTKWCIFNPKKSNTMYVGCYNNTKKGLKFSKFKTKTVLLHRVLLKNNKNKIVDHKNRIGLDNRISNLRYVTKSQNAYNSLKTENLNTYPGLGFSYRYGYWQPYIRVNNETVRLGTFHSKKDAYNARKKAEDKYLKEGIIYEKN